MNTTVADFQEIQEIQEFWYQWMYSMAINMFVILMAVFVIPFTISAVWVWCCTPVAHCPEYWANEYWKHQKSRDDFIEKHKEQLDKSVCCVKRLEGDLKEYKAEHKKYLSYPSTRSNVRNLVKWKNLIKKIEQRLSSHIAFINRHDKFVKEFTHIMNFCTYMMNNDSG